VERHDHRNAGVVERIDDRRSELVVRVVEVGDVRPVVADQFGNFLRRLARADERRGLRQGTQGAGGFVVIPAADKIFREW